MAKNETRAGKGQTSDLATRKKGLSATVKTSGDFKAVMSALMKGVLAGEVTPHQANAACNAGGKLLKVVELEMKYKKLDGLKMID